MVLKKIKKLKKYGPKMGFMEMKKVVLTFPKIFSRKTLAYTNQATMLTIKGDFAVYSHNFILGQVIPLQVRTKSCRI